MYRLRDHHGGYAGST
ncbi:MAG: hypothetical protein KJZ70_05850, partial [Bryobacterales bacterium]|nr:hypothetical protein [Bryobacterales bacterium]